MNNDFRHRQFPAGNPLASIVVVIVGALVIGLSLVLGFVALVALAGFMLVMAVVVTIRSWWHRRQHAVTGDEGTPRSRQGGQKVIEGEYTEVDPGDERPGQGR